MTTESDAIELYRIAMEECRFNVEQNYQRLRPLFWVPALRWGSSLASFHMELRADASSRFVIVAVCLNIAMALAGILADAVGIVAVKRGHDYYKRSRQAVANIERKYNYDWLPMWRMEGSGMRVHRAMRLVFVSYIVVDVAFLIAWIVFAWRH